MKLTIRDRTDSPRTMWTCYPSGYEERYCRDDSGAWSVPAEPGSDNGMGHLQTEEERKLAESLTDADLDRLWASGS